MDDIARIWTPDSMFHVHTWRCGHAFLGVSDEDVIRSAISLGADSIFFTDHAPFPGDPFGNRMMYRQLPEYIDTLSELKNKYSSTLRIYIGLEIEYLPKYNDYYKELRSDPRLELLLLGQHFYEDEYGRVVFTDPDTEWYGCSRAIAEGCKTGYFDVIAHPTRQFRQIKEKNLTDAQGMALDMIYDASVQYSIPLEYNLSCIQTEFYDRNELWQAADKSEVNIIVGLDAHNLEDLKNRYILQKSIFSML